MVKRRDFLKFGAAAVAAGSVPTAAAIAKATPPMSVRKLPLMRDMPYVRGAYGAIREKMEEFHPQMYFAVGWTTSVWSGDETHDSQDAFFITPDAEQAEAVSAVAELDTWKREGCVLFSNDELYVDSCAVVDQLWSAATPEQRKQLFSVTLREPEPYWSFWDDLRRLEESLPSFFRRNRHPIFEHRLAFATEGRALSMRRYVESQIATDLVDVLTRNITPRCDKQADGSRVETLISDDLAKLFVDQHFHEFTTIWQIAVA